MTFKPLITGIFCLSVVASAAHADPYCAEMLEPEALESRYQRLAPIYNATETGWIFASDQLAYRYVLTETETTLLAELVAELNARGTELAMLIAPPRPVVAGQALVDATAGEAGRYDMQAQAIAFDEMMTQIAAAGAIAPNLLALTRAHPDLAPAFYFQRDTHWTNLGAAHSALALAADLHPDQPPAFDASSLRAVEMAEEPGSLSRIVQATCEITPPPELSPLFDYAPHLPQAGGLLGDSGDGAAAAVLLGTSYSDRYGRDQYQSADALAAALRRPVQNRSVSGGGLIGPFETYILTGGFAAEQPDLIIWEFPYTYQLREANLRQLLGALRADQAPSATAVLDLGETPARFDLPRGDAANLLGLRMIDGSARDVTLRLRFEDGSDTRLRLRRKRRMEEVALLDTWWVDLRGFDAALTSFSVEVRGEADVDQMEVLLSAATG